MKAIFAIMRLDLCNFHKSGKGLWQIFGGMVLKCKKKEVPERLTKMIQVPDEKCSKCAGSTG